MCPAASRERQTLNPDRRGNVVRSSARGPRVLKTGWLLCLYKAVVVLTMSSKVAQRDPKRLRASGVVAAVLRPPAGEAARTRVPSL